MKVLVTGGTGFVGQALARRLHAAGHEVTAMGRNREAGALLEAAGIRFVRTELADSAGVQQACRGQEIVFHSGALSSPWGKERLFYAANVLGTAAVAEGCMRHGVSRMIHISTPSIYFNYKHRLHISEDEPLPERQVNAYARTKRLAEERVNAAFRQGLPVITLRPRAVFGPGDNALLPRLIRANERRFVPVIDGGRAQIDITYIDNLVDALLLCINAPGHALGQTYNITNGESVQLLELLQTLFGKLGLPLRAKRLSFAAAYGTAGLLELLAACLGGGREPLLTRYTAGVLAKSQTLDISAAKRDLGYAPRVSIAQGLDTFVDWWRRRLHDTR